MSNTTVLSESYPPWLEFPREITAKILHKLGAVEILTTAEKVCPTWRSVCMDADMWKSIDMRDESQYGWEPQRYDLEKMCPHAVDRSCGQLTDISIKYFATDDLLLYIFERSNQLNCLKLLYCGDISGEGLIQAVKKQPLLEELHILLDDGCFDVETIEVVGRTCPHLKSFKYDCWDYISNMPCDYFVGNSQTV